MFKDMIIKCKQWITKVGSVWGFLEDFDRHLLRITILWMFFRIYQVTNSHTTLSLVAYEITQSTTCFLNGDKLESWDLTSNSLKHFDINWNHNKIPKD